MNKKYHVKWAAAAERDIRQIIDYIAVDDPAGALRVFKKIKRSALNLYYQPARGRIVPELQDQGIQTYRELIIVPWRIIYRIADATVYVLSVIDARRNVEDLLLDRFVK
jgi:toxin ParE1/3/4